MSKAMQHVSLPAATREWRTQLVRVVQETLLKREKMIILRCGNVYLLSFELTLA